MSDLNPSPALAAHDLSRSFGDFQALAPATLALQPGEMAIVTGPNGAGKTTLLACLGGLLPPSTGSVRITGYDLYEDEREAKRRLAFVPDVPRFYAGLNVWEHVQFMALAHDTPAYEEKAADLLRQFGLSSARHLFPHALSRGMRLKLGLLLALIRPPSVTAALLLDEPTSALDPESTLLVREKVAELRRQGTAVILTTHDPDLAEKMSATHHWRVEDGRLLNS